MYKDFYASLKPLEGEIPYAEEERLAASGAPLLFWYRKNRRLLPWRENPEPYSVWISEIMLQQTRVEAVKPYFARFMEALPDITSLAQVDEERLLKLWEGLGYYSRARNLKKAAVCLMEDYGGQMPASRDEILKLPGIGSYTAGAVASIAYALPAPALDGNVVRVLTRLFADPQDSTKPALRKKYERRLEAELVRRTEIPICQPVMMPVRFPRHYGQKSYFIQVNIIRHGLNWARLSASRADVRSVRSARWNPFVWRTGGERRSNIRSSRRKSRAGSRKKRSA